MKSLKTNAWRRQLHIGVSSSKAGAKMGWSWALNQMKSESKRDDDAMSQHLADLVSDLGELKGSVVKVGQLLAVFGDALLPQSVLDALRAFEENSEPLAFDVIQGALVNYPKLLTLDIDSTSVGAGSLAQVHRAMDPNSGQTLCLKIQYPGVADAIESDLNGLASLFRWLQWKSHTAFKSWLSDTHALLRMECDFTHEAAMMAQFSNHLFDDDRFVVPTLFEDLSSQEILVTSFESGVAPDHESIANLSQGRRNALGKALFDLFLLELFSLGILQTDPNFGNYRIRLNQNQDQWVLLDFGAVMAFDADFLLAVKALISASLENDEPGIRQGAIELGVMQKDFPESVQAAFADLCRLLMEPFLNNNPDALNAEGQYCWHLSYLPKRAAKLVASNALSQYFVTPSCEFTLFCRKLLGVYRLLSQLNAEFTPKNLQLLRS
ncbi:MAG: AarF/UbiB family protein [Cellvibrionales bacterium]|nr:AarF/UbiB family protein [Cellvibrionales bacterium]